MIKGLNKERLKRLYIKEGKSTRAIAKMFGCSSYAVRHRCKKYGISLSPSQSGKLEGLNIEVLNRLYVTEKKSTHTIAKMFGCSASAVNYRCRRYGIKLRPNGGGFEWLDKEVLKRLYVKEGKSVNKIAKMLSCSYGTVFKRCEEYRIPLRGKKKIKGLTKALLQKLYVEEGKTLCGIAKIMGCSDEAVRYGCKKFGIPLRNPGIRKVEIDESVLYRLYINEGKTMAAIAEIFNCGINTISRKAKQFGLKENWKKEVKILEDKRKNPRLDFGIFVIHNHIWRMAKNLSLDGTFIKKDDWDNDMQLEPIGSEIDFSFDFPNTARYIDVKGTVIHHGNKDEGMGIRFKKIDDRDKEFIREFILDYQ
jgi:transposase